MSRETLIRDVGPGQMITDGFNTWVREQFQEANSTYVRFARVSRSDIAQKISLNIWKFNTLKELNYKIVTLL